MDSQDFEPSQIAWGRVRTNSHASQRRSSKKSSSQDRHGMVFQETDREHTIRAVTPESPSSSAFSTPGLDASYLPSPTSPSSRSRLPHRGRDHSASVSNTDEEGTVENKRRITRAKAKAKEETGPDASPNSFISKTRQRLGSITTNAPFSQRPDEHVGSIGYPSIIPIQSPPLPDLGEYRQRLARTQRRAFSPDGGLTSRQVGLRSPSLVNADSNKILHLMRTTCGRMHGILFFRPTNTAPWASGYCAINVAPGSLVCQVKGDITLTKTLIPDLRGCSVRTQYDAETQATYLSVVTASSGLGFQLRPPIPETFDSWLAALLCWQPLRPKGIQNKMTKPQSVAITERMTMGQRRLSDISTQKSAAVIKIGKVLIWDGSLPSITQRSAMQRNPNTQLLRSERSSWRSVSCTLHENGHFRLLAESDAGVLSSIQLSRLSRCAVQQLDPSVLNAEFCIAIYPQYNSNSDVQVQTRPVFLRIESRVSFEVWFVLFRIFTIPDLYGPEQHPPKSGSIPEDGDQATPMDGMFRVERTLSIQLTEARLSQKDPEEARDKRPGQLTMPATERSQGDFYAEVVLDRDVRARTGARPCTTSAFWAEEFSFTDLPPVLSSALVIIKVGNPAEREWTMVAHDSYDISQSENSQIAAGGNIEVLSHDAVWGKVEIPLDELDQRRSIDKWWPVLNNNDRVVGDLLTKVQLHETVILMRDQYGPISLLLHNFTNGLTTQMAQVLGPELKQLSDILLDIFQVSGKVTEWLVYLAEEEIDGIYKEAPPTRMRFTGRTHSGDSKESTEHRELLVRDLSRSATVEANLLFRGNSLVTKALDAHMRRLGKEYLTETLSECIRHIVESDADCEVDPARVKLPDQLERNWKNLISLTSKVWKAISGSATCCPLGLRILFKHIRSCAEDRYGSFIRTVGYSSVSGFLFLRFFCPAILNPKLFGLLKDHPPERPRRTFTLIAKSLIGLANMTKFGTKETWMEPMNKFLVISTPEFKNFINQICSVTSVAQSSVSEPQYTAPAQILSRLSPISREGSLCLPFLLDPAKLFANLVSLWLEHAPQDFAEEDMEECVRTFHQMCLELQQRTKDCLNGAEQAKRPNEDLEPKWKQLLADRQKNTLMDDPFGEQVVNARDGREDVAVSVLKNSKRSSTGNIPRSAIAVHALLDANEEDSATTPLSSSSAGWDAGRLAFAQSQTASGGTRDFSLSLNNSSTVSLEAIDDSRNRPLPGSRDGPGRSRLLDFVGGSSRRKAKLGGGGQMVSQDNKNEL